MTTDLRPAEPTSPRARLTTRQKILVAAVALGEGDHNVDALVMRAWELYPESFSLTGNEHPDSNRVLSKLSGDDGLVARGWLERPAPNTYRVTPAGRRIASALRPLRAATGTTEAVVEAAAEAAGTPAPRPTKPPRASKTRRPQAADTAPDAAPPTPAPTPTPAPALADHEVLGVQTLARCDALRKFLRGSPINFADACAFWGVSPKRPVDATARAEATGSLLARVVEGLRDEVPVDPRLPSLSTCYGLLNLHRLMLSRFARELEATRAAAGGARG